MTPKAKTVRAAEELPADASIERLVFLHKVEVGLKQAQEGKTVLLDEVEARLKRRRSKERQ